MAAIKIGTTGLIAQPTTYSFTPAGGQIATYRWVGTQAEVEAEYNTRVGDDEELQINTLPGGRAELVSSIPTGVQQSWEVDIQWNDRLPGQSNKFRDFFDGLASDTIRATFIADTESLREGTVPVGFSAQSATYQDWAWDIVYDTPIQEPTAVLRRTITWPAGDSGTTVNWTDVNKVWTTAQITALTSPPVAIIGTLPTAYWLMLSDSAEYGADGRFTASTMWVSGTYPTHKYTYKT
jgi:hypothetical protein